MSPPARLIHELFEHQVRLQPEAPALTHGPLTVSYGELNARANRLAQVLKANGVQPDQTVALCAQRSVGLVVGILAILKAGAAYVPLDPSYPSDRLAHALSDSGAQLLIHQAGSGHAGWAQGRLPVAIDAGGRLLLAPEVAPDVAAGNPHNPTLRADHAAYVIYTSGSTGQPKGVVVEHGHVTRLLQATQPLFEFGAQDVWTLFHSFAFDFSVWELWGALLHGGRLVIVSADTARSPEAFYELVLEERVTVLNQTPSAFRPLIAAQARRGGEHRLRTVIFGGEALVLQSLVPWFERNSAEKTTLVNMYGITEITIHATHARITPAQCRSGVGSVIGAALSHLHLQILDPQGQPVALGEMGEIHVGGASVARGYLNQPELTASRFLSDPRDPRPGARMYKTGDLARQHPDGQIEYLGRNDFQVKIRGHRIELGEIEATLLRHPGVQDAVVLARDDPHAPGEKQLAAYCVGPAAKVVSGLALRAFCQQSLAPHMVPSHFDWLERLPLTPNGKIDRHALQVLVPSVAPASDADLGAVSLEARVCELWRQLLCLSQVQPGDDFFALGGNSLSAVRMTLKVREWVRGSALDIAVVFHHPVARDFAQAVQRCAVPAPRAPQGVPA
ncbi:MAG: amino acid adenylation domain-containing protein [Pseudomonadota bacterium]